MTCTNLWTITKLKIYFHKTKQCYKIPILGRVYDAGSVFMPLTSHLLRSGLEVDLRRPSCSPSVKTHGDLPQRSGSNET